MCAVTIPGQPDHEDFWLMVEIVQDLNNAGDDDVPLTKIVSDIDLPSLTYMAEQRAMRVEQILESMDTPLDPQIAYASVWMEAFKSGIEFQKRRDLRKATGDDPQI
jgi:hypothetical protein